VLECLGLGLRVAEWEMMAMGWPQLGRPALRLLSGSAACMATGWCILMAWGIIPPCASVVVLAPGARAACQGPRTRRSRGEVVRGRDFSREEETSCVLTVNSCIKVRLDLQADKSPAVVKDPSSLEW
jgi:hypothetical protein